jgi:hypothetical protein
VLRFKCFRDFGRVGSLCPPRRHVMRTVGGHGVPTLRDYGDFLRDILRDRRRAFNAFNLSRMKLALSLLRVSSLSSVRRRSIHGSYQCRMTYPSNPNNEHIKNQPATVLESTTTKWASNFLRSMTRRKIVVAAKEDIQESATPSQPRGNNLQAK